jgi:hypothetical protein
MHFRQSGTTSRMPSAFLRWNLVLTDLGFIFYWALAAFNLFPSDWLYKDHDDPILTAWNWSFAPVDLAASLLGLSSLISARRGSESWSVLALLSVALTFCAGLMAVSFWAIRRDFDPVWWVLNLYLASWPLLAVPQFFRRQSVASQIAGPAA